MQEKEKKAISFSLIAGIMMSIKTDSKAMLADVLYDSIDIIIVFFNIIFNQIISYTYIRKEALWFFTIRVVFLID